MLELEWLIESGLGPAVVALPFDWAADALAQRAQRWFRRLRRADDLSRLISVATTTSVQLTHSEFGALRRLLEDQETWRVVGRGPDEDLVSRITSCLSPQGRTPEESRLVARTIARGLLEFTAADLDPKLFQQVLLARLQRMETAQGSAVDAAMLRLHADLAVGFAAVIQHLDRSLDRLPPGPAGTLEVCTYLKTLIDWLSADPWPRDSRFSGPLLSAPSIERMRRIRYVEGRTEQDLNADDLAKRCERLIILGGPGSGKTWLAKRIARRCAEDALAELAAGQSLEQIELPLYTTCSHLQRASGKDIRDLIVSSTLSQIADLGSSRLTAAIHELFTRRTEPTLVIIDALDETSDPDERLGQADTLKGSWRVILTSRPGSWNNQFVINPGNDSRRVGELQPLRYPDDVEPVVDCWFQGEPGQGRHLLAQIACRADLQQTASVPLILAFYCIIGATESLPQLSHHLYSRVLDRMLTGRWRDHRGQPLDAKACRDTLRGWAWSGAAQNHPVSGVGMWADGLITEIRASLSERDQEALNHIAVPQPQTPAEFDTGEISRRFIHRTIREFLVAEQVASLPVDQAVTALLPHLWYDPDWEYAAVAALAMHPRRSHVLADLMRCAAGTQQAPTDLAVIDGGTEFRRFLARVAAATSEADWMPEIARVIGDVRVSLALEGARADLPGTAFWMTSNSHALDRLQGLLAKEVDAGIDAADTQELVSRVLKVAVTPEDKRQASQSLLALMAITIDGGVAGELAAGIALLGPTKDDEQTARNALLELMADNREKFAYMADYVAALASAPQDKRLACKSLLSMLSSETYTWNACELVSGVTKLDPTAEERRIVREKLFGMLASETSDATELTMAIVCLTRTPEERRCTRETLLNLLADWHAGVDGLMGGAIQLAVTPEDKSETRDRLLILLTGAIDSQRASGLANGIVLLDPTADDRRLVRGKLLALLTGQPYDFVSELLANLLIQLAWTIEDKGQVRQALLELLARKAGTPMVAGVARWVSRLEPTAEDQRLVHEALSNFLPSRSRGPTTWPSASMIQRDAAAKGQSRVGEALLGWQARQEDGATVRGMNATMDVLNPAKDHYQQIRRDLLTAFAGETGSAEIAGRAKSILQLDPTSAEKRQIHERVLKALLDSTEQQVAAELVRRLAELDPTAHDLSTWHSWAAPPTAKLLATVRRNSALGDWLAILPSLAGLST